MQDYIMGDVPLGVVVYYFIMWFFNASAYWVACIFANKLAGLVPFSRATRLFKRMAFVTGIFGLIRTFSGLEAMMRFFLLYRSTTATLEFLGVVSLFLNTSFICSVAIVLVIEVRFLRKLDIHRRKLLAEAGMAFDDLKAVTEIHRTDS